MHDFNPRTPAKECDWIRTGLPIIALKFQSTHPREGVRRRFLLGHQLPAYFNPRTPAKECDDFKRRDTTNLMDFNPRTPAKECDVTLISGLKPFTNFNPRTPAKECDAVC